MSSNASPQEARADRQAPRYAAVCYPRARGGATLPSCQFAPAARGRPAGAASGGPRRSSAADTGPAPAGGREPAGNGATIPFWLSFDFDLAGLRLGRLGQPDRQDAVRQLGVDLGGVGV